MTKAVDRLAKSIPSLFIPYNSNVLRKVNQQNQLRPVSLQDSLLIDSPFVFDNSRIEA